MIAKGKYKPPVEPSPEEIARLCQEIQSTWTPKERQRRLVQPVLRWTPPGIEAGPLGLGDVGQGE